MIQPKPFSQRYFTIPDGVILLLVATAIYGVVSIGNQWRAEFHPVTEIDLSIAYLPYYTLLSGIRGFVAYFISLTFTLIVGYLAAHSQRAERIIIPLLDILQSIPVLGFLPGLLLGLVALFPRTNTGLELAAILMIFTGQVWNMTFSYYASLKSIPSDLREASTVIGLSRFQILMCVELPYSAVSLAWNSLLSMAGGWFFLIPCEAMTLGEREYRLPGIGSYMDMAIKQGNMKAIVAAVLAMVLLIVTTDFVVWRPIFSWVQKFRSDEVSNPNHSIPLMQIWIRESNLLRWIGVSFRRFVAERRKRRGSRPTVGKRNLAAAYLQSLRAHPFFQRTLRIIKSSLFQMIFEGGLSALAIALVAYGTYRLLGILFMVSPATWIILLRDTLWTLLRVLLSLMISTAWAVPIGIWIATSPARLRFAQPIVQVMASFPAPMLYPLVLSVVFFCGIPFDWAAMLLMVLGVQWYVLFNVLAGALRIPQELKNAMELMDCSKWERWKTLYIPSIFPSLATGWVSAAGGAWNASVVAEYLFYKGTILKTAGLGAALSVATANEDFTLLAASLTLMVFVVIFLNRSVWSRIFRLAHTRYRMEI